MNQLKIIKSPEDLAALLKEARDSVGANQSDLARLHDLSRYTITDAESGKGNPKLSTILTLLNGLGLSIAVAPSHLVKQLALQEQPEDEDQVFALDSDADWELDP